MKKGIHNYSEIGKLNRVLLHRPGRELEALTPATMERLLFDDVPYLKEAQKEHDQFAKVLKDQRRRGHILRERDCKGPERDSREGRICQQYDRTQFHRI